MKNIQIKVCGQTNPTIINHCLNLDIDKQGLIFYEKSPRFVGNDTLSIINNYFQSFKKKFVGVFVNPSIDEIESKLKLFDFGTIQLHGNEDQSFINTVKQTFNKPLYKAVTPAQFIDEHFENVDLFLIEGAPSKGDMPGGNNKSWDWSSFENPNNLPFMISGGLNITNIKKAIDLTGANFVDINSGVEDKPGIKNISLIEDLVLSLK